MSKPKQIGHRNRPVNEEIPANEGSITPVDTANQWGEDAMQLVNDIVDGPHFRKKRHTLLLLTEATYHNQSQAEVFKLVSCASKVAHYKWRDVDPAYEAAYQFLIGNTALPGIARLRREHELDEAEQRAIGALAEARATLRLSASEAAYTLQDALKAENAYGPKWHERISAANSILDRSDKETARQPAPSLSLIDQAIMSIYGRESKEADDTRQAGLQADNDEAPTTTDPTHVPPIEDTNDAIDMSEDIEPPSADRDIKSARQALDTFFSKVKKEVSDSDKPTTMDQ